MPFFCQVPSDAVEVSVTLGCDAATLVDLCPTFRDYLLISSTMSKVKCHSSWIFRPLTMQPTTTLLRGVRITSDAARYIPEERLPQSSPLPARSQSCEKRLLASSYNSLMVQMKQLWSHWTVFNET